MINPRSARRGVNRVNPERRSMLRQFGNEIANLTDTMSPSVPRVLMLERGGQPMGLGSGVCIELQDGGLAVATCDHVAAPADKLQAVFQEELGQYDAQIIISDPVTDTALIRIPDDADIMPAGYAADVGDDDFAVNRGDIVVAAGSPLGMGEHDSVPSFTHGGVSDLHLEGEMPNPGGHAVRTIDHTSRICPGNSGGPLFNLIGEVVGLNAAGIIGMSVYFATPVEHLITLEQAAARLNNLEGTAIEFDGFALVDSPHGILIRERPGIPNFIEGFTPTYNEGNVALHNDPQERRKYRALTNTSDWRTAKVVEINGHEVASTVDVLNYLGTTDARKETRVSSGFFGRKPSIHITVKQGVWIRGPHSHDKSELSV